MVAVGIVSAGTPAATPELAALGCAQLTITAVLSLPYLVAAIGCRASLLVRGDAAQHVSSRRPPQPGPTRPRPAAAPAPGSVPMPAAHRDATAHEPQRSHLPQPPPTHTPDSASSAVPASADPAQEWAETARMLRGLGVDVDWWMAKSFDEVEDELAELVRRRRKRPLRERD